MTSPLQINIRIKILFFLFIFSFFVFFSSCNTDYDDAIVLPEEFSTEFKSYDSCTNFENGDIKYSIIQNNYYQCKDNFWEEVNISIKFEPFESFENQTSSSINISSSSNKEIPSSNKNILSSSSHKKEGTSSSIVCEDGDKLMLVADSSYYQCINGDWSSLDERWIIEKDTNTYHSINNGKLLPSAGFFKPFAIHPPKASHGGEIHCTFDGSAPTLSSETPTKSILIDSTTSVRCVEFVDSIAVNSNTETYFINDTINMPVLSINTTKEYFEGYIKEPPCSPDPCKTASFWEDIEYPAHIEYFADGSKSLKKDFEFDAGISIMGGYSRNQLKKSLAVKMKDDYQKNYILNFPLFDKRKSNSRFKSFNLRNNGNRFITDYICDPVAVSLLEGTNVDYQRSRQVVVFINGEFRGIYDLRERLNEHFIETNYGIPSNQVEFIEPHGTIADVKQGSLDNFNQLKQFLNDNNISDTTTNAYEQLKEMLDIDNFIDYMAAEIYYHNGDWPHNNVRAWRTLNRPWRFIAYDIDHGFGWRSTVKGFSQATNMIDWIMSGGKPGEGCSIKPEICFVNIFIQLIKHPEFKRKFINKAVLLYKTHINSHRITQAVDEMTNTIDPKQIERDTILYPRTYTNTCIGKFDATGECVKRWAASRDSIVLDEFRKAFDLGKNIQLSFYADKSGKIKVENIDLPSNDFSATFFAKHPVLLTAVPEKGYTFDSWENGSRKNPRVVAPQDNQSFAAFFKKMK